MLAGWEDHLIISFSGSTDFCERLDHYERVGNCSLIHSQRFFEHSALFVSLALFSLSLSLSLSFSFTLTHEDSLSGQRAPASRAKIA